MSQLGVLHKLCYNRSGNNMLAGEVVQDQFTAF